MQWISVENETPEFGSCLIYVEEHSPQIYLDCYGQCSEEYVGFVHELLFETKVTHWMPMPKPPHKDEEKKFTPYCPFGPYAWVIIEYDGHHGFACDWQDCLEEIIFIDGHSIKDTFISYKDPKLTHFEPMMCLNQIKNYKVGVGRHDFPISTVSTMYSQVVVEYGGDARCITSDGRNVNMAEELNRLDC